MKRIAGLDTLRFLAFLAIFFFHSASDWIYGYGRVDFFFVLSSFLLTWLTLREIDTTNGFSKRNFFWRRALRIFPLYFLVLIVLMGLLPLMTYFWDFSVSMPKKPWMYWLFLSNYENSDTLFSLKLLWSVSVQEQFYLIFLFIANSFKRHLWTFVILLVITYVTFMLWAGNNEFSTYSHTITHFVNFAAGMAGAFLFYNKKYRIKFTMLVFVFSCLSLILITPPIIYHIQLSICFISLILVFIEWAPRIKKNRVFMLTENLGRYTYGLYVYSGFTITIGTIFLEDWHPLLAITSELFATYILAMVSYDFYEKQFLKLKPYFRKKSHLSSG